MRPSFARSPAGQSLLQVLIAGVLLSLGSIAFLNVFKSQTKATRNIAAQGGVTDLSHALDALFGSAQCATSGIFLSAGAPAAVTVSGSTYALNLDTIQFATGVVALTSLPDATVTAMIQPYSVSAIAMSALGGSGAAGTGFQFPFQLKTTFASPSGPPPLPLNKFVTIYTDATRRVVGGCYSGTPTSGAGFSHFQVFSAGGNFVVPAAVTAVLVEVWGAGGGGGNAGNFANGTLFFAAGGGGGGAGGYCRAILPVTAGASHAIVVGAAGAAGATGATGGDSSFGGLATGSGGSGGGAPTFSGAGTSAVGSGGNGGTCNLSSGLGTESLPGGKGAPGAFNYTAGGYAPGPYGALGGAGGMAAHGGATPGGGGRGGAAFQSGFSGTPGGAGQVVVWW